MLWCVNCNIGNIWVGCCSSSCSFKERLLCGSWYVYWAWPISLLLASSNSHSYFYSFLYHVPNIRDVYNWSFVTCMQLEDPLISYQRYILHSDFRIRSLLWCNVAQIWYLQSTLLHVWLYDRLCLTSEVKVKRCSLKHLKLTHHHSHQ